jgi:hypothetical protein
VFEQHYSPRADDDAGSGHMDDIDVLVERGRQLVECSEERHDRLGLALIDRHPGGNI